MPAVAVQGFILGSRLPWRENTSHGKGLSSGSGDAVAAAFAVGDTLGQMELAQKARPSKSILISSTGEDVTSG